MGSRTGVGRASVDGWCAVSFVGVVRLQLMAPLASRLGSIFELSALFKAIRSVGSENSARKAELWAQAKVGGALVRRRLASSGLPPFLASVPWSCWVCAVSGIPWPLPLSTPFAHLVLLLSVFSSVVCTAYTASFLVCALEVLFAVRQALSSKPTSADDELPEECATEMEVSWEVSHLQKKRNGMCVCVSVWV